MMDRRHLTRMAIAALAVTAFGVLHPAIARANQHIVCPESKIPLEAAAPILGPLQEPWGELHSDATKTKDGSIISRYNLTGGVAPQLEKWLICYYRDGTHQAVKLPTTTKECAVTSKREVTAPATKRPVYLVIGITCE
jgi:hypothetical protein